ncbi:MAG: oligosaccharide repeat unit polymerase [Prevotella sp.]|nr:oligosaccharide repeat unit polymerase [Prevotella sp.]MBR1428258.1 oligosaccharide repeat unit polymerase [Prevotella sp.]
MSVFIIITLFILIGIFLFFHIGDAFSPWMITCTVWAGILILFLLSGDFLYPLGSRLYNSILIWVPGFVISSLLTYYALPSINYDYRQDFSINDKVYLFFFAISMVFTPLYIYQIVKIVMMFGTHDLLYNLRILAVSGEGDSMSSILKYVNGINQAMLIVTMWKYPHIKKSTLLLIVLANIFCSLAIMEKTSIFFLLLVTLFVLYEKKKIHLRMIIIWGIILLIAFYGFNGLRQSESDETEMTFIDFFSIYVLSPSVAYERVQENLSSQYGNHTFAFIYAFLNKTGLAKCYVETKLQAFVWVPLPTNVYTVFQPFYEDFGYPGIAFFSTLYGIISGSAYRLMKNGNKLCMCIYIYIAECLVLQFYQENLLISMSLLIQYVVVIGLIVQNVVSFQWTPQKRSVK